MNYKIIKMKKIIKNILTNILCAIYNIKCGKGYYIGPHLHVYNIKKKLTIGKKVKISAYTTLLCVTPEARISMGDNIRIAHHLQISCAKSVIICSDINIGPYVFITDHNHKFEDPKIPVKDQGISIQENARIEIGSGSWIGTKVTIIGNVRIGRHCVIGANSVVTKDIPDYCVAAGVPAKVIRKYDPETRQWAKTV